MDKYVAECDIDEEAVDDDKTCEKDIIFDNPLAMRDKRITDLSETISELESVIPKMKQDQATLENQAIKNKEILEAQIKTIVLNGGISKDIIGFTVDMYASHMKETEGDERRKECSKSEYS